MKASKLKQKLLYWIPIWIPSMIVGAIFSIWRRPRRHSESPSSIVVFMIDHIGDAILSSPMLRELKSTFPQTEITIVVSRIAFPIVEKCPYASKVIISESARGWLARLHDAIQLAKRISHIKPDLIIVPKDTINKDFNELVSIIANAGWKISLKPPRPVWRIRPMKFKLFYDEFVITEEEKHEVEYKLDVVRHFTSRALSSKPEAWLGEDDIQCADEFIATICGDSNRPIIAFGIGASVQKRCWPLEYFASTIDQLSQDRPIVVLVIASPQEAGLIQRLTTLTSHKVHFLQNATLRQNTALLRRCSLFIGNDSGPMHMASSVEVPVVELSCHPLEGPSRHGNSPHRFGPLSVKRKILYPKPLDSVCVEHGCQFETSAHCITNINPDTVTAAAITLLDR